MNKKTFFVLFVIVCIGFFFRLYKLGIIPSGIDWDEASFGYNAYSIAKTGTDEWGNRFPLMFHAFGDSKLPVYIYITSFILYFFDLTVFTARLAPAILGALSIILIYFIAEEIFENKYISLLSAFFFCLSPFSIFYSRLALDIGVINFFILSGVLFELLYIRKKSQIFLFLSTLSLILSFFSYNAGRIIAPIFFMIFFIIHVFFLKEKVIKHIPSLILITVTLFIGFFQMNNGGLIRMNYMGIFGDNKSVQLEINEFRSHDKNSFVSRILHNKLSFFSIRLIENYITHFSPKTLGYEAQPESVQVSFHGPLYAIQIPFYFGGIFFLISLLVRKTDKQKFLTCIVLIVWVLVSPLPSIITEGAIHRRYLGALGSWELLSAFGISMIINRIRNNINLQRICIMLFGIIYVLNCLSFLKIYFIEISKKYSYVYFSRQNTLAQQIIEEKEKFESIYISKKITAEPHIFMLFFSRKNPTIYQKSRRISARLNGIGVTGFDNLYFPESIQPAELQKIIQQKKTKIYLTDDELSACEHVIEDSHLVPVEEEKTNVTQSKFFSITL